MSESPFDNSSQKQNFENLSNEEGKLQSGQAGENLTQIQSSDTINRNEGSGTITNVNTQINYNFPPTDTSAPKLPSSNLSSSLHKQSRVDVALSRRLKLVAIILTAVVTTSLVVGARSLGTLQVSELSAFDKLMKLQPRNASDERILVITVTEKDKEYQDKNGMERKPAWSLSDSAFFKLLQLIEPYQPKVVGLDIYHPFKFESSLETKVKSFKNLTYICEVGSDATPTEQLNPPPNISNEQLGFSDFPIDPDITIRRQLLLMSPGEHCKTSRAFSLQVALSYLKQLDKTSIEKLVDGRRTIGGRIFERLPHNAGGYELPPDQANGYQVLLNYRYRDPINLSLASLLNASSDKSNLSKLIKDRIVLIGVDQPSQDRYLTAYGEKPGVFVHAHMISQILDIVLQEKPLIQWLPQWGEVLWIGTWALIGGLTVQQFRSPLHLGICICIILTILCGACFVLLINAWWVPIIPSAFALMLTAILVVPQLNFLRRLGIRRH